MSRSRSRSRPSDKRDGSSTSGHVYRVGQRVERRDAGEDWEIGYVVSENPVKVSMEDRPDDEECFSWDEVRPLDGEDYSVKASPPPSAASTGGQMMAGASAAPRMQPPQAPQAGEGAFSGVVGPMPVLPPKPKPVEPVASSSGGGLDMSDPLDAYMASVNRELDRLGGGKKKKKLRA